MCTSHYLDLFITVVIGLNVITMAMEHYQQPQVLDEALKICNYVFTIIFVLESVFKLVAFGFRRFFKDRWNQLDLAIVLLSIMGITLEEIEVNASLPINPTIIRIMRVLRIARVLKLLKMAVGMRALLDTVIQALPQDTLRDCAQDMGTCYNTVVSPIYFVSFVLTAQFVLVNVVIAVLMKHLEESNKEAKEEAEMEAELEMELRNINSPSPLAEGLPWPGGVGDIRDRPDSPGGPSDSSQVKLDSPLSLDAPLIPLAEMEALSLTSDIVSEKSWSLALTDDSMPDDINTLLLNTLESNVLEVDKPVFLSSLLGLEMLLGFLPVLKLKPLG
ncbi:CAC1G protein, partial [Polypterus senegalus]